ncbi:HPP family protein [Phyllosticta citrichinensis]|uniref:HPP family protein n=1 Tax=Phyllosticta citrichinensis TaxID=1130410 RepID=A0ABR1XXF6_9PEZI
MRLPRAQDVHFDMDDYLNLIIPRNRISRLPKPLARLLGYRESGRPQVGNILIASWALLGAFLGLIVITAVYKFSPVIQRVHPPVIVASLGAAAILEFNVIDSPLATPRNAIVGNTLAAIAGVGVAKLFMLSDDFESLTWVAGPLCCGVASWVMTMTNTAFPPGGATAILAATDSTVRNLGWMYIGIVLLGSVLMFGVALIVNNIQRQFPLYWWTPRNVGPQKVPDVEKMGSSAQVSEEASTEEVTESPHRIIITERSILVPEHFGLGPEETEMLEALRKRLRSVDPTWSLVKILSVSDSERTQVHSSRETLPALRNSEQTSQVHTER